MSIDFKRQILHTTESIKTRITEMEQEVDGLNELRDVMIKHAGEFGAPVIEPIDYPDVRWRVWIPPFREDHFEGDDILAPFGDTYWPNLVEACRFLESTLVAIEAGEYGALAAQQVQS